MAVYKDNSAGYYGEPEAAGFEDEADVKKHGAATVNEAYRALPELLHSPVMLRRYLDGMRRIERQPAVRPVCRQRAPRARRSARRSAAAKATASASDGSGEPDADAVGPGDRPRVVLTFAAEDDPATRARVVAALADILGDLEAES